ncbi:MAG: cupin domain-containing protein [Betaproteobacteria bacterium]|nr:cupin domain-containing protein [Betaproteobacteria bacterium]
MANVDNQKPITEQETFKRFADGGVVLRTSRVPWMPWAAPGTYCKVLHIDMSHAKTTLMIKVDPGTPLGVHKHLGDAEAYMLEGSFTYEHGSARAGEYLCEKGGIRHVPVTGDQGLVLLGMNYGSLHGEDDAGNVLGVIDNEYYYKAAAAAGCHLHLSPDAVNRDLVANTANLRNPERGSK